ncbi:protein-disulfide reductase DsbD [Alteromonas sp. 5E99-2]|uniref:protein-disulfide reductase DsbD n=1 Tax=Alteromonas sp. 5E99-2 TaxID=2817683 RepID=UPI001A994784|nr:protein-disulfide reductase DsbD [Alteromonas sp. 5E99-2]MBO1254813.1 protein-disulfide reductase DsbD [Alteromonas sp. 5E99-2]
MQFKRVFSSFWFVLFLGFVSATSHAQLGGEFEDPFADQPKFLPIEEAFQFDFNQKGDSLIITFDIADGYYLYKKQFKTTLKGVELGEPEFPVAKQIEDEFFGISDVFYNQVTFSYPLISAEKDGLVALRFQGCASAGLCYPPTIHKIYLGEVGAGANKGAAANENVNTESTSGASQFGLAEKLANNEGLVVTLIGFLGLGVLLAFTPCVFPMYPILSSIVIGQGNSGSTGRAFWLSFIYVQGMAITYSLLGLVVASAGVQFQAALQNPILLSVFIVIFILLALAMFGTYELQLPSSWQERLSNVSNNQKQGNAFGVFVMGILSGLVASPCTTAPLTAILLYIAQSGDLFLGFIALYVLSIGMGIPLILFGVTGGKLLPKAGGWMNIVKVTFGFMMIAVAILFIERMWISEYSQLLYSALGLAAFGYYFVKNNESAASAGKNIRTLVVLSGLIASAIFGYEILRTQLLGTQASHSEELEHGHPKFIKVTSLADFKEKLAAANANNKTVMVDLYADWCVACKEFETRTFPNQDVVDALSNSVWMQIDLTDVTPVNDEFQEHFDVLGLPTILFFDTRGNEVNQSRITGFMKAEPFAEHINSIF